MSVIGIGKRGNTVAAIDNETYFVVKNKDGAEYLCPLKSVRNRDAIADDEMNHCVEREIVERYSGNINSEPC
jgi:hypothetical protein